MRKVILFASIIVMLSFFNISCENDNLNIESGDMCEISFDLDVEAAPITRAISDGTGATQLMYAVFDEANQVIYPKAVKNDITTLLTSDGYTMMITLPKGNTYRVVFWAQNPECTAYTVSDDMNVSIDYAGINNDEVRDAFFAATEPFKVDSKTSKSVTLKRPFAQVNVGAYPYDMEYAQNAGVDISKSSAIIKAVPNAINLLDGTTSGYVDINYTLNDIPAEDLLVDVDEDGTSEVYEYLSMSYLLASAEGTLHEMAFGFTNADESKQIEFNKGLETVPVKRNWRTNIVGQILTGEISFNIKIDPTYDGETINSAGLYYNFSDDTTIENKVFAFNAQDEWVTFTTENNNLLTFNNVKFSGKINQIAIGEYRGRGQKDVPYTNVLNNVTAQNISVSNGIENVPTIDYMSILFYIRGISTLNNCVFTGTTTIVPDTTDYNGNTQEYTAYDCGIPNFCNATFNNCTISSLYAWSHSMITLENTKVDYIRCSTHKKSYKTSHLTIGAGCEIDTIFVSSTGVQKFVTIDGVKTLTADPWGPSLIIKDGAKVNVLDLQGRTTEDVIIESGATIGQTIP